MLATVVLGSSCSSPNKIPEVATTLPDPDPHYDLASAKKGRHVAYAHDKRAKKNDLGEARTPDLSRSVFWEKTCEANVITNYTTKPDLMEV
jgi:hypothetical protein